MPFMDENYLKIGAGAENRTPISSLENLHTNRCTTPASLYHCSRKML